MKSIIEMRAALQAGKVSSKELAEKYLKAIESTDGKIHSFLKVCDQSGNAGSAASGEAPREGRLAGIPIAVKDMIVTKGVETTAGSKILNGYVPPYSATLVEKLEAEGAFLLGKNNQDEFAMGSSNEASAYSKTLNPWKLDHVPGGSSGGSAAAVAARLAPASIGTDTGGSVRQPANFCGVVGMKPTYGRISRYGVIAYASSLDQAGPVTTTVKDAALLTEIMSGQDEKDQTTSEREVPSWTESLQASCRGRKIAVLEESFSDQVSTDVQKSEQNTIEILKAGGAEVETVSFTSHDLVVPTYHLIAMSEASSNLARYDGIRYGHRAETESMKLEDLYCQSRSEGFGEEVKRRLMIGSYSLSSGYRDEYYIQACRARRKIFNDFKSIFEKYDAILSPVATGPAFKVGERFQDPVKMYLNDIFTASVNLAGLPALSLPTGLTDDGLPLGVQLIANSFNEQMLFDVGSYIEAEVAFSEVPDVV